MASTPYNKPATSAKDQTQLLIDRGLVIDDLAKAEHYLTHVGFYRLAGYWLHLQDDPQKHTFIKGTNFLQAIELYEFDREIPKKKAIAKIYGLPDDS
ncbi:Abi family protein, partial [Chitinophaga sancti]